MIYILLPAYNEAKNIKKLIDDIAHSFALELFRIVVVNDGSSDATRAIIEKLINRYPVDLLNHEKNFGLGVTLKDGLLHIKQFLHDEDIVITMDADGTHLPEYMESMMNECKAGHPLVVASRYSKGGGEIGLSSSRSLCSRIANTIMKNMFAVEGINDYTSGYRAYKGSLLIKGFNEYGSDLITEKGFTCMAELLIKLSFIETNFKEIPFILRYDYKKGQSKMRVIQTIMKYIFLWSYLKKLREVKNHH